MVRIGFGTADLTEALPPQKESREACEVKAIAISDEEGGSLWLVLDLMDFDLSIVQEIKEASRHATGFSTEIIHILTTHNHGGADCSELLRAVLCRRCQSAAQEALCTAEQALVRGAWTHPRKQLNYIRRVDVPEVEGTTTVFFGPSELDGYDSSPFVEHYLRQLQKGQLAYSGQEVTFRPIRPFPAPDDAIFIMEFISSHDRHPLGSIVRFSAHPVCCNVPEFYSSDYPWHVRQQLGRYLGGIPVFMNGPCAEIAPGISHKRNGGEQEIGNSIAEAAWIVLQGIPFEPLQSFRDSMSSLLLPVRREVLEFRVQGGDEMPLGLPGKKQFLEAQRLVRTLEFLDGKYRNGVLNPDGMIAVELGMLILNQTKILAFPGETFSATATAVVANDPMVVTVTEHGRTAMYLPPEEEYLRGGYEYTCAVTASGAEKLLRQAASSFLKGQVNNATT